MRRKLKPHKPIKKRFYYASRYLGLHRMKIAEGKKGPRIVYYWSKMR